MSRSFSKTKKITTMGLLFALAMVLSFVENTIVPFFGLPPGVKLGLSNIVVMYCMVYMGGFSAFQLALLKGFFGFITRGATGGFLATMGGVFSVAIMYVLQKLFGEKVNYYTLSIFGALFHNIGQLVGVSFIFGSAFAFGYFPVLAASAVPMGFVTGAILKVVIPALKRLG